MNPSAVPEASGQEPHETTGADMAIVQPVGLVIGTEEGEADHQQGRAIGHRPGDGEMIPPAQVDHSKDVAAGQAAKAGVLPVGQVDAQQVDDHPVGIFRQPDEGLAPYRCKLQPELALAHHHGPMGQVLTQGSLPPVHQVQPVMLYCRVAQGPAIPFLLYRHLLSVTAGRSPQHPVEATMGHVVREQAQMDLDEELQLHPLRAVQAVEGGDLPESLVHLVLQHTLPVRARHLARDVLAVQHVEVEVVVPTDQGNGSVYLGHIHRFFWFQMPAPY